MDELSLKYPKRDGNNGFRLLSTKLKLYFKIKINKKLYSFHYLLNVVFLRFYFKFL